ncbi:MAG: AAA family ATPase, partial [Pseudomonadota bacterium]
MVQFSKLRLSGFKSFVDKTELEITDGLTGIVGPNGCGKSNLVEALRWVMGEASSKKMRGSGSMEDVIFNGTSNRPRRNNAEVSLLLDNLERTAPAAFNGSDDIEIVRRIERDKGSNYKINGKTQRARDVQMLFADTVTGANSPALVSQGRVTAMINAKPQERRLILEESAGISGLYARRHEAELRLRAADQNLQRVEDLLGSMEGRYNALKKQVRQAAKYKDLSAQIRQLEVTIAYLEWRLLKDKIEKANKVFLEAESVVAERMAAVTQLSKTQNTQAEDLPDLRKAEAEAAAALQAQKMELQRLEDQERALEEQLQTAVAQLEQTEQDRTHERESLEENTAFVLNLDKEQSSIEDNQGQEEDVLREKQAIKERLEEKVSKLEEEYENFMASAAETRASRQAIEGQIASEESRLLVAQERKEKFADDLAEARKEFGKDDIQDSLKSDIQELEKSITMMREDLEAAEKAYAQAKDDVEAARTRRQTIDTEKAKIESEINSLKAFLEAENEGDYTRLLDEVQPDKGFETALSKALGDTLMASTDDSAPVTWLERSFDAGELPVLPAGVSILEPHVKAPGALKAALSMIGVVDNADAGHEISKQLKPGQSLVSKGGAYWRWDGLYSKAEAADSHAVRLEQKNKLTDLQTKYPDIEKQAETAEAEFIKAREQEAQLDEKTTQLKRDLRENEDNLSTKHSELSRATEERSGLFAQIAKLEEGLRQAEQDIQSLDVSLEITREKLDSYDDQVMNEQNEQVERVRQALSEARDGHREALRALDHVQQEKSRRKARLHAIADERINLQNRIIRSRERLKELDEREENLKKKVEELKSTPKVIGDDRQAYMDKISEVEAKRNEAADNLRSVENELAETTSALKEAESILTEAREERASAQATVTAGQEQLQDIETAIGEKFEIGP